ncbi:MAG: hypothetical protein EDM05_038450 [Leptolyngbya sp. IPPAS B-1204]|nr:hypothetical protein [Elainella sp. C42_A2020_010]RNJ66275.1 MAG: hypothetical protein EDM05_26770 [Leptolyngbya sp. IPPAS B-1204]
MGKKRINQLLEQLKENQQQDLQNAAAIFTVAQVAVNRLREQVEPVETVPARAALSGTEVAALLPAAPIPIERAELERRYGSFNACRQAAKAQGIKFSKTPSWPQLSVAFGYLEACQQMVQDYLQAHPNEQLKGVSIELKLG